MLLLVEVGGGGGGGVEGKPRESRTRIHPGDPPQTVTQVRTYMSNINNFTPGVGGGDELK